MQLNLLLLLVSSILLLSACGESEEAVLSPAANSMTNAIPFPPVAKKIPYELEAHGDVRIDDYYWLRDDERVNPEMLAQLEAERLRAGPPNSPRRGRTPRRNGNRACVLRSLGVASGS